MICSQCKRDLDEINFYPRKNRKKKLTSWCKDCLLEHRIKYADRAKIQRRCKAYNTTEEFINELYKKFDSRCAICKIKEDDTLKKSLCIDHDHETGEIRGLLCDDCNVMIGRARDNISTLKGAIKYLQFY